MSTWSLVFKDIRLKRVMEKLVGCLHSGNLGGRIYSSLKCETDMCLLFVVQLLFFYRERSYENVDVWKIGPILGAEFINFSM